MKLDLTTYCDVCFPILTIASTTIDLGTLSYKEARDLAEEFRQAAEELELFAKKDPNL